jgi:signal transduction histidine kinase
MVFQRQTPFCYTRAPAASVIQVLVNLLLNAIQQIGRTRGRMGGRIAIELAPAQARGRTVYRIQIEDDGPGIHWRLWERIFEMGYTEREEGSGLGLFISRNLVTGLGGQLFVAASAIHWGSTFVLELPQQN